MRQKWRNAMLRGVCVGLISGLSAPLTKAATPEQVNTALEKAVAFVNNSQQGDNWEAGGVKANQETGPTAIAVYALLAAGQTGQTNPKLNAAIQWLLKNDTKGVYALGLRAQVWNLIEHDKNQAVRDAIKKDAVLLLECARKANNPQVFRGLYHYVTTDQTTYDHSCSQYGVLGMWGLERAGLEVPDAYWEAVEDAWKKNQEFDGGWSYMKGNVKGSSVAMTAAGIATLFITQDYLRSMDGIKCTGNISNIPIDKGMKWMQKNLETELKAHHVNSYGLYGIERIGVASGYKYFGTLDWFKTGSDFFVATQSAEGSWGGFGGPVPATCFGILFLSRGRAPVVMNKLEYSINGKEAHWNQRPRDAANAVKYVAKQMERDLNWQIVNLGVEVNDFHDSQILYIAGNEALNFTPAEEAKLKQFVEEGGLILGHADCADPNFTKSFKALGLKLFKNAGEFKVLQPTHPIYTRQQFLAKNWKNKPDVLGLTNGVRELMLLIPSGDPGKAWQLQDDKAKEDQFQLMSDIFLYAVEGKDLRFKGSTYIVNKNSASVSKTIKVARLDIGDNSDPEPGGWKRLGAVLHNDNGTDVQADLVKPTDKALEGYKIAHLTGTGKLKLNKEQEKVLKDFVTAGGTLVIDAAGGDSDFSASAEEALNTIFGKDASQLSDALPVTHALFSANGSPIGDVSFRSFARGKVPRGQTTPLLRGITIDNRLAVIFSREDLSGGLVGESIDGITGYSPESATNLMRDIVLFAGNAGKPVATVPPKVVGTPPPASKPATKPDAATKPATSTK